MIATRFTPSLRWLGAGCPVFFGDMGRGSESQLVALEAPEEIQETFGPRGPAAFRRTVDAYFRSGGQRCYVIHVRALEKSSEGRAATRLLGEDGGPGCRTGLNALADLPDAGTVALPGVRDEGCLRAVADTLRRQRSFAIVAEGPPGSSPPSEFFHAPHADGSTLSDRAVWLDCGAFRQGRGAEVPPSGPALGALEGLDYNPVWSPRRPGPIHSSRSGKSLRRARELVESVAEGLPTLGERYGSLKVWRCWEGIRRSIDLGTRWVLFEIQDAFLPARVEREVRGFLYGLRLAGLLDDLPGGESFRVSCTPAVERSSRSAQGRLQLTVRIRLRGANDGEEPLTIGGVAT